MELDITTTAVRKMTTALQDIQNLHVMDLYRLRLPEVRLRRVRLVMPAEPELALRRIKDVLSALGT